MKKILVLSAAILLPALIFGAGGLVEKGSPQYGSLETLSENGNIKTPLKKDKLTRAETAAYIIEAVDSLLLPEASPASEVIELAYKLLMEFQTDVMEKGVKLSEVQQKMVGLKVLQESLKYAGIKERQDALFGMIGVKINGEAKAYLTDLVLYGHEADPAMRYQPVTQYIDMKFTANSGSTLKAEAVFRMENLFGGNWGTEDIYGVRKFTITGDFPVSFILGDYQAKLTPLTIWSQDDARKSEAKVFRDKREMIKNELWLEKGSWPVTGAKLSYSADKSFPAVIEVSAMAARLQEASGNNYVMSPGFTQLLSNPFIYSYDQYMFAARAASDFSLKDILNLGLNFVDIRDIKGTGIDRDAPSLDNFTGSADAEVTLFGAIKAKAEFAFSGYKVDNNDLPQPWQNQYITDTALRTKLEAEYFNTKAEAEFFVVGNSYTAYAAQSRIYDEANNYKYLTQNNTYNISENTPYFVLSGQVYPFTRYNSVILAGYFPVGYNLMPYSFYENASSPYGGATPNRQGVKAKISGKYLDGMLMPYAKFSFASEIVSYLPSNQLSCPREYLAVEAGLKAEAFNTKLTCGYKYESVDNKYTGGNTHTDSNIIDAGLEYRLFDRVIFHGGFRGLIFKGSEYIYGFNGASWSYSGLTNYDTAVYSYGGGVEIELTKQASAGISYTNTLITDVLNSANDFGAQEFDARVVFKF